MHDPLLLQSPWDNVETESLVDPVFGYTLERLWGLVMHCSDQHMADWSPSLAGSYILSACFG